MNPKATPSNPIVLATVSGADHPGITSELTYVLAQSNANVLDIGQAVIHGWLSLSILFELPEKEQDEKTTLKDLLFKATELGLKLEFKVFDKKYAKNHHFSKQSFRYAITLISDNVTAQVLHQVTNALVKFHSNIDIIQRLSESEFSCVEIMISTSDKLNESELKKELLEIATQNGVDIALQAEGLYRRSKRLVVFDMDSTLIQNEVIDEFARQMNVYDEVSKITESAMNGEIDFNESLKQRCSKLKGLTLSDVDKIFKKLELTPGADELIHVLKKLGYKIAIISGGFVCVASRFKESLGIDFAYANTLEFKDGVATGNVIPPIVNTQRKADLLELIAQQENIELDQVIAIGDGANDILMLEKAGLGIAFNAKVNVRKQADLSLNKKNLRSIFYLIGIPGREISAVLKNT